MIDETNVPADGSNPQKNIEPPAQSGQPQSASPQIGDALSRAPISGNQQEDLAKILKEIKLPERNEHRGTADRKPIQLSPLITDLDAPIAQSKSVPDPQAPIPPAPAPAERPAVESIHTLKEDLQHVVRDQKMSLVRAAALEQEKRRPTEEERIEIGSPKRSRLAGYVAASFGMLVLGALALFGVYYVESSKQPPQQEIGNAIVFAEQSVSLPLTGQDASTLKQTLAGARVGSNAGLGSITRIVPIVGTTSADQRPATFSEFMAALGAHPPEDLIRALSDDFFVGLHTIDKNAPLIVVPVVSYDRAFAGMLAWENAMNGDLAPFFTPLSQYTSVSGIPEQRRFSDVVLRNYDIRALKDDSGQIELYYSFPTRNVLIIAESPYTFSEVLARLQADRKL